MSRKVAYTVIIGKYDPLIPVPWNFRIGWDLRCFTDQPLQSDCWKIIPVSNVGMEDRVFAKRIKILSHAYVPDADLSIYIDGSMEIIGSLNNFIFSSPIEDWVAMQHRDRNCAYAEMDACIVHKRALPEQMQVQKDRYLEMGFPEKFGLFNNQVIARLNSLKVAEVNETWWRLTESFATWRDQLTLPLAFWKSGFQPRVIPPLRKAKFFCQRNIHFGIYDPRRPHGD
jgi:hypothetical protein